MKRLLLSVIAAASLAVAGGETIARTAAPMPAPNTAPVAGETLLTPPTPGFNPRTAPDANLPTYGEPPRPPAGAEPEDTTNWNAAADLYPTATTNGAVNVPAPTPTPTPAANIPAVVLPHVTTSTITEDCNVVKPCFAGITALTAGNTISTATNYISFTVPYLVHRGTCPTSEAVSIWAGNQYGGNLWQAGIIMQATFDAACNATSWAFTPFYEDYPTQKPQLFPGVSTASPGDVVMFTIWNTNARTAKAQFSNITKAQQVTVSYGTKYDMNNPAFMWIAETQANGVPPKFGVVAIRGIATDQAGKMYRAGDVTNGDIIPKNMINSGDLYPTWISTTGIGAGTFNFDAH